MVSPINIINITDLAHSSNKPIKTNIISSQTASQTAIKFLLPQALLILFSKLLISPQTGQNPHIFAAIALKAFFGTLNTFFSVQIEAVSARRTGRTGPRFNFLRGDSYCVEVGALKAGAERGRA